MDLRTHLHIRETAHTLYGFATEEERAESAAQMVNSQDAAVAAALREAQEETGLGQEYVDVLGTMPPYETSTGFSVTPVASLVRPGFTLVADAFEVAEIFEVPLAFLMDPANHRLYQATTPDGRTRQYYAMPWEGHFIWGATAGMLRNFYRFMQA